MSNAPSRFEACLAETLKWEGGWSNHKDDPGGPTMKGVIQRVYDAWREKNGKPRQPVRLISDDELTAIYRENYWTIVRGDELPAGLDLAVFDFGVNSGPVRAIRYLQDVLSVKSDGHMGPVTVKAANDANALVTIGKLMAARRQFLNKIPYRKAFIKGWMNRCKGIEQACIVACGLPLKEAPLAPLADPDAESATQGRATHDPPPPSPAKAVAGGIGAGAVGTALVPAPPPAMVESMTQISAWQSLIATGQSVVAFGFEHWPWVVGAAGTMIGLSLLNRRVE
jgi:lysozyme family protein